MGKKRGQGAGRARDDGDPRAKTPDQVADDLPTEDQPVAGQHDDADGENPADADQAADADPDADAESIEDGAGPVEADQAADENDRHDENVSRDESTSRAGSTSRAEADKQGDHADVPDEDAPPHDGVSPAGGPVRSVRRLLWASRRPTAAGTVIGVLLGLLGFALVVQLRSNGEDPLSSARPEDLVRILSDLDARKDRLSQEISKLQTTERQLAAGNQSQQAALTEAARRADELGILAGALAAHGPGIVVRFFAEGKPIRASDILDAVEELRGAGAEAMQIDGGNGASVRIIASTSFVDGDGGLIVDGQKLTGPYTITAIGDPQTMQPALNIPGGVLDAVKTNGGNVIVAQPATVTVSTLSQPAQPRYAHPVS